MTELRLRPITQEELGAAAELDARAFRIDVNQVRVGMEGNSRYSWRDVLTVERDGEMLSVLTAFPMDLWLAGGPVSAVAIAGVAVPPENRRRGVARFMLRETHAHFRAAGVPISILYPFSYGFYRSLGYEIAEWRRHYALPPDRLPLYAERHDVRLARPSDWPDVHRLYETHLRARGGVQRSEATWTDRFHNRDAELVVYVGETGLLGYLQYEFKRVEKSGGEKTGRMEVQVREFIAQTARAERGLLGFLAAQQEQADVVRLVCPPDMPLALLLSEPRGYPTHHLDFIMYEVDRGTAGIMLRVLDVPKALTARGYPAAVVGALTLTVDDPETSDAPAYHVSFAHGQAVVQPLAAAAVVGEGEVSTDIATLSGLYAGAFSATWAERLGRLQGDEAAIALLDAALAAPPLFVQRTDWF